MLQIHPFNKVHETPPVGRAQVSSQGHRSEPHEAYVVGSQARGRKHPESHKGGTKTDGLSAGGEKELLAHGRAPPGATARHTCPGLLQGPPTPLQKHRRQDQAETKSVSLSGTHFCRSGFEVLSSRAGHQSNGHFQRQPQERRGQKGRALGQLTEGSPLLR